MDVLETALRAPPRGGGGDATGAGALNEHAETMAEASLGRNDIGALYGATLPLSTT